MPTIYITRRDGSETAVDADVNLTLMEVMTQHDLDVEGVCGGSASCGTCHVYVPPEWLEKVGDPEEVEAALLGGLLNTEKTSRLGCQITLSEIHEGLVVSIAPME
jgi:ferredoxin, 2Fe-2S